MVTTLNRDDHLRVVLDKVIDALNAGDKWEIEANLVELVELAGGKRLLDKCSAAEARHKGDQEAIYTELFRDR